MTRFETALLASALMLPIAARALADGYQVDWCTVDGGGAMTSAGGAYSLAGTIAQPDARSFATPMTGGTYSLVGGFWPVALPTCSLPGDMDLSTLRNGADIQGFVNCLLGINGTNCTCADISGNGAVGPEDLSGFVQILIGT
jgi:hypothetical protein